MTGEVQLSGEKLTELKRSIREKLKQLGVDAEIRRIIAEGASSSGFTKLQAMDALQEKGLIQQLVQSLGDPEKLISERWNGDGGGARPRNRRFLSVNVRGGRGFAGFLEAEASGDGGGEMLQLHLELFGHRFKTSMVPAAVDPTFQLSRLVELPGSLDTDLLDLVLYLTIPSLVQLRQPLRLVVVRSVPEGSTGVEGPGVEVLGCGAVEWRRALSATVGGRLLQMAEVGLGSGMATAPAAGSPILGTVEVMLELLPPLAKPLDGAVLRKQLKEEGTRDAERVAAFGKRARSWWSAYVAQNPAFRERLVKVLAYGEDGVQRPVCGYVSPLRMGRLLASPREAAHWVSLLGSKEEQLDSAIYGGVGRHTESWGGVHSVLAARVASKEERAVLLCSLLLGFGLDAWVAVGRNLYGGHMWVVTLGGSAATFWEPSTGERFGVAELPEEDGGGGTFYGLSVDSMFNNTRLYANRQPDTSAATTRFHLSDASLWRELRVEPEQEMPGPLMMELRSMPNTLDCPAAEETMETELRAALERFRWDALGVAQTKWSARLSYLLMPALSAYEQEMATGQPSDSNEEFQQAIKRAVPAGFVFKGFPKHFTHCSGRAAGAAMLAEHAVQDMLASAGPGTEFGLRVRVTPYPDEVLSVWAMLCAKHPA